MDMHVVELQQAEMHLARLVEEAAAGDRIVIARGGKPVALLSPFGDTRKQVPIVTGSVSLGHPTGLDGVVPPRTDLMTLYVQPLHLRVGYPHFGRVYAVIPLRTHHQPG